MGFGSAMNSGHVDANQQFSMTGVAGSLGTADVGGTALTMPIGVDPTTGAVFVNILAGAGAASNPTSGTLSTLGTVGTILGIGGTVTVTGASAGTNVNIVTGTQQTLGTVGVVNNLVTGTLAALTTVTTVSNLTNGSVNILTGTLQSSGTTTGVGVVTSVTNLAAGTITSLLSQSAGTMNTLGTVGVINNVVTGTIAAVTAVTTVSNLTNGSVNLLTGTVTSITNLANGTVHQDLTPVNIGTALNQIGTTGAAVWGTLVASSGNGIKQYVSGVYIVVETGTVEVAVTNIGIGGSTGAGVLARGNFPAGGGIQRTFNPNIASGTGGTIAYWLGGAGTVSVGVDYWQGA